MRSFNPAALLLAVTTLSCGEGPQATTQTDATSTSGGSSSASSTADPTVEPTGATTGPSTTDESTTTTTSGPDITTTATTNVEPPSTTRATDGTTATSTGEPADCEIELIHRGDLVVTDATPPESLRCIVDVTGRLIIKDTQKLTDFGALGSLRHVGDDVEIAGNAALLDLEGLRSLERVDGEPNGEIAVHGNPALVDVTGLRSLERVDSVTFSDNAGLALLAGLQGPITGIHEPHWTLGIVGNGSLVSLQGIEAIDGFAGRLIIGDNLALAGISALAPALAADVREIAISGNPALADLQGLEPVVSAGTVIIADNAALVDLSGLDGLEQVQPEGLVIEQNAQLLGLDGLNALTVATEVWIEGNPALTNLDALTSLDEVSKLLRIGECGALGNDALLDLSGLSGLSTVGFLQINANDALTTLAGLPPMLALGGLRIFDNTTLPTADAAAYADQVGLGDAAELCNNLGAPETCDCMQIMP